MRVPEYFRRHRAFIGDVATMMSGKSVASLIALVTMPIIARLFSPRDFGIAALFLSTSTLISNIGALRYEVALVLPDRESEAILLMACTYRILVGICLLLLVVVGVYEACGVSAEVIDSMGIWIWFLPLGVLLMTMIQIQENWLARRKSFKVVATSMVVGTTVTGGSRIGFGYLSGSSVFGLIAGQMIGQVCRLAVQKSASSEGLRATFSRIGWAQFRRITAHYSDFPRLTAPAALLTAAGQQLPVVLLGVLFTPAVVGYYSMATRLTHSPIVIVANSMRRVFLQKAAEINNRGKSLAFAFAVSTGGLALLGAFPLAILWFFGQPLTVWLLGDRWTEAGRYLEIIAPWLFMLWVTAPSNPVFVVLRKQKLWLNMQISATVFRLGTFALAYVLSAGPEWTLGAFVTATVIGNVFIICMALYLILNHGKQPAPAGQ